MIMLTLNTGEKVHFKEKYTHGAERVWLASFQKGVHVDRDLATGNMQPVEQVPSENLWHAYEAILPHIVLKIEMDGREFSCTQEWLNGLSEHDYQRLEDAARDFRTSASSPEGKKKA